MPKRPDEGRTSGSEDTGTPNREHISSDHAAVARSRSIVRLALDGSVAWTRPPVRFHRSQESIVPNLSEASASTPPSVRSHSILLAEK